MTKSLIIVRGLPGSGKNTFANLFGAPICCADDYLYINGEYVWTPQRVSRAHMICQSKCEDLLKKGESIVIVANTNIKERDVNGYTKLGKQYGYTVFSIIVENRHGGQNEHGVPDEMIANMAKNFSVKLS